jgi:para-nitrobenzyl esterase
LPAAAVSGSALKSGEFNKVPVIIGTNHDEWRLFVALQQLDGSTVTAANYEDVIEATLGVPATAAAAIAVQYPLSAYSSPAVAMGAVGTDAIFACPALSAEDALSAYVPTYAYEFNDENAPQRYLPPVGFAYGAAHESEVQYLFALRNTAFPAAFTKGQLSLAALMKQDWTNFAKSGHPAGPGLWPRYSAANQKVLSLLPPKPELETDYAAEHQCSFWAAVEG